MLNGLGDTATADIGSSGIAVGGGTKETTACNWKEEHMSHEETNECNPLERSQ